MTKSLETTLQDLAGRQYGLLTWEQLRSHGLSHRAIADLQAKGWMARAERKVYRLAGAPLTWRSSAMAAVLSVGGDALISHHSAGVLWGLLAAEDLHGVRHVTSSRPVRRAGIISGRGVVSPGERARRHGIPVTSLDRTVLDISQSEPAGRSGRMIDDALRSRLTTVDRLAEAVDQHRRRGAPRLRSIREALALRGGDYDPGANPWEQRMDRLWDEMGLPPAARQRTIVLPGGRRVRPDRVVEDVKLVVEWNGFAWHGLRSDFESDIERRNLLIREGWTVLEFHSRQTPTDICESVLSVYNRLLAGAGHTT